MLGELAPAARSIVLRARDGHYVRVSVGDAGAYVTDDAVTFVVPDPARTLSGVRLVQDVRIPGDELNFSRPADAEYRIYGWRSRRRATLRDNSLRYA